jgi:hypothetical protein
MYVQSTTLAPISPPFTNLSETVQLLNKKYQLAGFLKKYWLVEFDLMGGTNNELG